MVSPFHHHHFAGKLASILLLSTLLTLVPNRPLSAASETPSARFASSNATLASPSPASPTAALDDQPAGNQTDSLLYDAVLAPLRADVRSAAGPLSRYRIEATLHPGEPLAPSLITGTVDLQYVNDSGQSLNVIYFRLYANDPRYAEGSLNVADLAVDGKPVATRLSVDDTVLGVPLPSTLPTGASANITLGFTATIPVHPARSYGIFAVQPSAGTWLLAHWFPLLAGRDVNGWELDPVSLNGDPIFSNTALFDVSLTAPANLTLVTSGRALATEPVGDAIRRRYVTGPSRDFTIVADDDFASVSTEINGTTVTSYYNPEDAAGGARVLEYAVRALRLYGQLFGTYPYREMDLAEAPLRGAAGVEFPQLVFIGDSLYAPATDANAHYLEFVVAHEVAHQWWYALVGNNQYVDAFIDEGLAEYCSSAIYFGRLYGSAAGQRELDQEGQDLVPQEPLHLG